MLNRHVADCLIYDAHRQSSPASSGGVPDFGTPSHSQSFMDLLSPMANPLSGSSPLLTPGGRALGRGLDDSPCISSSCGLAFGGRAGSGNDSPASVVSRLMNSSAHAGGSH